MFLIMEDQTAFLFSLCYLDCLKDTCHTLFPTDLGFVCLMWARAQSGDKRRAPSPGQKLGRRGGGGADKCPQCRLMRQRVVSRFFHSQDGSNSRASDLTSKSQALVCHATWVKAFWKRLYSTFGQIVKHWWQGSLGPTARGLCIHNSLVCSWNPF